MTDSRFTVLADNLINYSLSLGKGEKVLIETTGFETEFTAALVKAAYAAGALPFYTVKNAAIEREWLCNVSEEQLAAQCRWEKARMEEMDAYIGLRLRENSYELSAVGGEQMRLYETLLAHPVHQGIRVPKTKWVVLRYPNDSMAQEARMSTNEFRDFYFRVCNLDYAKMSRAMSPLVELMNKTDKVEIVSAGTELRFSIKNIGAVKCNGLRNIPDGEVYTAPVRDSVEGFITYNAPSVHQGKLYRNIRFDFSEGRIVNATCDGSSADLNAVLDTDEGARYIGEFAIGMNPHILHPISDTLFDEKIAGSIHFTPGQCYDTAYNGNKSAIHWDLVSIHRADYGGGEIYFDGKLIRRDGIFVLPELACLNPENLK